MEKINIQIFQKILIIAPHPDDESIGCGALLAHYGEQCDVIFMTDGRYGNPEWAPRFTAQIRMEEAKKAMELANVKNIFFMGIKDGKLFEHKNCLRAFDLNKYDFIFVPGSKESNPDHRAAYKCLINALKYQHVKKDVFEYEVWTPLINYSHFITIDHRVKENFIECYKSQLKHINYLRMSKGLGLYRSSIAGILENVHAEFYNYRDMNYFDMKEKLFIDFKR